MGANRASLAPALPMSADDHQAWLEAAHNGLGRASDLAEGLMETSLAAARQARADGDVQLQRYMLVVAGQAYAHVRIAEMEQSIRVLIKQTGGKQ